MSGLFGGFTVAASGTNNNNSSMMGSPTTSGSLALAAGGGVAASVSASPLNPAAGRFEPASIAGRGTGGGLRVTANGFTPQAHRGGGSGNMGGYFTGINNGGSRGGFVTGHHHHQHHSFQAPQQAGGAGGAGGGYRRPYHASNQLNPGDSYGAGGSGYQPQSGGGFPNPIHHRGGSGLGGGRGGGGGGSGGFGAAGSASSSICTPDQRRYVDDSVAGIHEEYMLRLQDMDPERRRVEDSVYKAFIAGGRVIHSILWGKVTFVPFPTDETDFNQFMAEYYEGQVSPGASGIGAGDMSSSDGSCGFGRGASASTVEGIGSSHFGVSSGSGGLMAAHGAAVHSHAVLQQQRFHQQQQQQQHRRDMRRRLTEQYDPHRDITRAFLGQLPYEAHLAPWVLCWMLWLLTDGMVLLAPEDVDYQRKIDDKPRVTGRSSVASGSGGLALAAGDVDSPPNSGIGGGGSSGSGSSGEISAETLRAPLAQKQMARALAQIHAHNEDKIAYVEFMARSQHGQLPPNAAAGAPKVWIYQGACHLNLRREHEAILVASVNKRVLFDETGLWVARTEEEIHALNNYCNSISFSPKDPRERHNCYPGRPNKPLTVAPAEARTAGGGSSLVMAAHAAHAAGLGGATGSGLAHLVSSSAVKSATAAITAGIAAESSAAAAGVVGAATAAAAAATSGLGIAASPSAAGDTGSALASGGNQHQQSQSQQHVRQRDDDNHPACVCDECKGYIGLFTKHALLDKYLEVDVARMVGLEPSTQCLRQHSRFLPPGAGGKPHQLPAAFRSGGAAAGGGAAGGSAGGDSGSNNNSPCGSGMGTPSVSGNAMLAAGGSEHFVAVTTTGSGGLATTASADPTATAVVAAGGAGSGLPDPVRDAQFITHAHVAVTLRRDALIMALFNCLQQFGADFGTLPRKDYSCTAQLARHRGPLQYPHYQQRGDRANDRGGNNGRFAQQQQQQPPASSSSPSASHFAVSHHHNSSSGQHHHHHGGAGGGAAGSGLFGLGSHSSAGSEMAAGSSLSPASSGAGGLNIGAPGWAPATANLSTLSGLSSNSNRGGSTNSSGTPEHGSGISAAEREQLASMQQQILDLKARLDAEKRDKERAEAAALAQQQALQLQLLQMQMMSNPMMMQQLMLQQQQQQQQLMASLLAAQSASVAAAPVAAAAASMTPEQQQWLQLHAFLQLQQQQQQLQQGSATAAAQPGLPVIEES